MSGFSCETVGAGSHYAGLLNLPTLLGLVSLSSRTQAVRFDASTIAEYPGTFGCASSWSKLWGASRCGFFHPHQLDSDRFVWRRASDSIEIAAYAYDDGKRPYGPDDPNLLQPFGTHLAVGTTYTLGLDVAPSQTAYTIGDANGTVLETRTVAHGHACANAADGYKLGLYFGGSCAAPSPQTVCYSPEVGWPQGLTVGIVLVALAACAACCVCAVRCCRRRKPAAAAGVRVEGRM